MRGRAIRVARYLEENAGWCLLLTIGVLVGAGYIWSLSVAHTPLRFNDLLSALDLCKVCFTVLSDIKGNEVTCDSLATMYAATVARQEVIFAGGQI